MDQDINTSRDKSQEALRQFTDVMRANQAATDTFDEAVTQFLGINRTDGRCLDIIDRLGRVSAGQLANESGLTTGAVTAVIDRLEAAGYARRSRDPLDRRKIWVETTEAMRAIQSRIFSFYEKSGPSLMSRFTPEQMQAIVVFLRIGTFLNLELAASLKEHFDPAATTTEARLIQARAFERAVEANRKRLEVELDRAVAGA